MNIWYLLAGSLLLAGCGRNQPVESPYSFYKEPFIHPRIVQELTTWWSDTGDQVISINLPDCQKSDRFYGKFKIESGTDSHLSVICYGDGGTMRTPFFEYQYVGRTKSGIDVLKIQDCGGGTLVAEFFLLVTFEKDHGLEYDKKTKIVRQGKERILIKRIGELFFERRTKEYVKSAVLSGNTLHIRTTDSFDPLFEGSYTFQIP